MYYLHISQPVFTAKNVFLFPHFDYSFVLVIKAMTGNGRPSYLQTINTSQIMSEQDMIRGFFKDILKPIITEALQEAAAKEPAPRERRFYTREEACRLLHIGTTTFYRLAKKGKIVILKIEGKTLVDANDLDEAIETRSVFRYQH